MKGRRSFSRNEIDLLRLLIRRKEQAVRSEQKALRQQMRDLGFYISDFQWSSSGFGVADFDQLVADGIITATDAPVKNNWSAGENPRPHARGASQPRLFAGWLGETITNPTLEDLIQAVKALPGADDSFVIYQFAEDYYIQALGSEHDGYVLEYRDGADTRHYQTTTTRITQSRLVAAFQSYWEGNDDYLEMFRWRRIRPGTSVSYPIA